MQNKITVIIANNRYTILADEPAAYMQKVANRTEIFMQEAHHLNGGNAYSTGVLATLNATDTLVKTEDKLQEALQALGKVAPPQSSELAEQLALEQEKTAALTIQLEKAVAQNRLKTGELEALQTTLQDTEGKLARSEDQNQELTAKLAAQVSMLGQMRAQLQMMKEAAAELAQATEALKAKQQDKTAEAAEQPAEEAVAVNEALVDDTAQLSDEVSRLKQELNRQVQVNNSLKQRKK